MIHQINMVKPYTQVDSLLQEMLLGGQDGLTDNGIMASPPSSPGSPPALALVNHHHHHHHVPPPPSAIVSGGYLTPPIVTASAVLSGPPPGVGSAPHMVMPLHPIEQCYSAHLA